MKEKLKMHAPMILIVVFNVFFGVLFFGRSQEAARNAETADAPAVMDQKLGIVTSEVDRSKLAEEPLEEPPEELSEEPADVVDSPKEEPEKVVITTEPIYLPTETNPDTTLPRKPEPGEVGGPLAGPSEDKFTPIKKATKPRQQVVKKERRPRAALPRKPAQTQVAHKPKPVATKPRPVKRRVARPHKVKPERFVDLMTDRFDGVPNYEGLNNRFGRNPQ